MHWPGKCQSLIHSLHKQIRLADSHNTHFQKTLPHSKWTAGNTNCHTHTHTHTHTHRHAQTTHINSIHICQNRAQWFLHTGLLLDQTHNMIWAFFGRMEPNRMWKVRSGIYMIRSDSGCTLSIMAKQRHNQTAFESDPACLLGKEHGKTARWSCQLC